MPCSDDDQLTSARARTVDCTLIPPVAKLDEPSLNGVEIPLEQGHGRSSSSSLSSSRTEFAFSKEPWHLEQVASLLDYD